MQHDHEDLLLVVTVVTRDEPDRPYLVNYAVPDTKRWLTRTTVWCATNDRELRIRAATAQDVATRKLFTAKDGQSNSAARAA